MASGKSYSQRAVKSFAVVFIINIIAAFLGYLIRIVLARNLTLADYGLFFSVFALINFIAIFNNLGLGEALVKYIPDFLVKKKPGEIKNSIVIVICTYLLTSIIIASLLVIFSNELSEHYFKTSVALPLLLLFIIIMFFSNLRELLRSAYQAFQKMTFYAGIYLAENALILIMLIFFFVFSKSIFTAAYSYIVTYVIILIIFAFLFLKTFQFFNYKFSFKKELAKILFKFGLPVTLLGVGSIVILYTDTLVLTYFRSLEEVGVYNVVVPTAMLLLFFTNSIGSVLFPMVSELWAKKDLKKISQGLEILEKYSFAVLLPLVTIMFIFSNTILRLLFGAAYASGATAMQVLLIGILFMGMFSLSSMVFAGIGKPMISTKILLLGGAINLILNFFLIPRWGMLGAAFNSLLAYFLVFILSVFKLRKLIKVKMPWLNWLKTIIAGIAMVLVIIFMQNILVLPFYAEIILSCLIAGLVYVGLILLMRIVNLNEIKSIIGR
ncbi:flippase [Candidatus Woesearchaeota archaeon]|nr:flippase [Candidatus Woesearchaeota archaeon]